MRACFIGCSEDDAGHTESESDRVVVDLQWWRTKGWESGRSISRSRIVVVQLLDYLMSLRGVSGPGEQELALAGEEQEKRSAIRALYLKFKAQGDSFRRVAAAWR